MRIYNGLVAAYSADSSVARSAGASRTRSTAVTCLGCHAVHGAKTLDGGNNAKVLKDWTYWRDAQGGFSDYSTLALAKWPTPDDDADKYEQQSAWCTGCHKYYIESYDESATAVQYFDGTGWAFSGSHVMTGDTRELRQPGGQRLRDPGRLGAVDHLPRLPRRRCGGHHRRHRHQLLPALHAGLLPVHGRRSVSMAASSSVNTTGTVDGLCLKCHRDGVVDGVGEGF